MLYAMAAEQMPWYRELHLPFLLIPCPEVPQAAYPEVVVRLTPDLP